MALLLVCAAHHHWRRRGQVTAARSQPRKRWSGSGLCSCGPFPCCRASALRPSFSPPPCFRHLASPSSPHPAAALQSTTAPLPLGRHTRPTTCPTPSPRQAKSAAKSAVVVVDSRTVTKHMMAAARARLAAAPSADSRRRRVRTRPLPPPHQTLLWVPSVPRR